MTCEEFFGDDEETIVYRPRSYIEIHQEITDVTENPSDDLKKSPKGKRLLRTHQNYGSRGSFTEIKNNVLNIVNSPRGRRRSKTTVLKQESVGVGERIKMVINRTASLDTLKIRSPRQGRHKSNKSMEESIIRGFSQLANQQTITKDEYNETIKINDANDNVDRMCPSPKNDYFKTPFVLHGKDRSHSCPTYPKIIEEDEYHNLRPVVKSVSYDEANLKRILDETKNCQHNCPMIKVDHVKSTDNIFHYENVGKPHNISCNSSSSLSSTQTIDSDYITSDTIYTVSTSQQSERILTSNFNDNQRDQGQLRDTSMSTLPIQFSTRPRSLVDIFKQENEEEFHFDSLDFNRNSLNTKSATETVESENTVVLRQRSSTFSSTLTLSSPTSPSVDTNNTKHQSQFKRSRSRAKSMIDFQPDKDGDVCDVKNRHAGSMSNLNVNNIVETVKKSHKFHTISSPKVLKKIFKRKRESNNKSKMTASVK